MAMHDNGLTKLTEESAELLIELISALSRLSVVASKKAAYQNTDLHPDGKGSLAERLENEIADVLAAAEFVIEALKLNLTRIEQRYEDKVARFKAWENEHATHTD